MSLTAALCVNVVTVNMLLSVFFLSDVSADYGDKTAADLFITAPKEMEALSGSCLLIPCNFRAKEGTQFDSSRDIYGVWIKSDSHFADKPDNVIFNSSQSVNSYKMKMIGNLREQNCTTLFSDLDNSTTKKYFFRIENGPFKATACANPLQITVRDFPWSPRINISGEVKEKKSVTISCSASTPCPHSPPQLTWNLQQNSHSQIEKNTDGTFTSKIQQSITLSDSHNGFNISCSATYPVGEGKHGKTKETQLTLNVTYAPKETSASISPSGLVSAGSWVNLTCSSRANPPVSSFSWFLKTEDGSMSQVAEGHFYRHKMTNMTENYYCNATNILGNQRSSWIHLKSEESFPLSTILAGIVSPVVVLIFLLLCVCCLKRKNPTLQQTQNQTGEEEEIHYGDIKFSDQRPAPSSVGEQDSGEQQETVYSQIQVSKPESSSEQTAEDLQDLYAEVNKK
ncbi:sialic acid-binding Ig-like lectin 13 [Acanthochromis polyacanthus]|uniref:sialic acid-binding Ig-like lectin 13 n=1 Tax=Acanthochromis polyacanthus TaxID=80966 RepID=UPI0022340B9C|nr:sialic acid-binding Ig-like lectin 13 [Acanthochromis polyacanthus]